MNLNIPDTRQQLLAERLAAGSQIVALEAAAEFDVSVDTIRRDILALEAHGKAQRVRGGAVPVARPAPPLHSRLASKSPISPALIRSVVDQIETEPTLVLDGGTTTLSIVSYLPALDDRLVMTPSPWVAVACQERGVNVFLIGGALSLQGGITTGDAALVKTANVAADVAILGACGLDPQFGLSSDDLGEAEMKVAMSQAAARTIVVTDESKIGRRARHHTLALGQIDQIITDASPAQAAQLRQAGADVVTV